ncbi:MAG: tRNA (cytidine(56)-2'-O)-methyltransferase [archaeon GB-1867-005]|nr:tRNA (cytidine(56)-2'-O)-methyltransferase [Candidatus Culexmicrobium cathedralense]
MKDWQYKIVVLRIGHRPERDKRVTTHVGLVARAFGADGIAIDADDESVKSSLLRVVEAWGGPFTVEVGVNPTSFIRKWRESGGEVIHLTMYGLNLPDVIDEIRRSNKDKLIIVGAEKVPKKYYLLADWNVAIGNQPHSEVAALAVFLKELTKDWVFRSQFKGAKIKVCPSPRGKKVVKLN